MKLLASLLAGVFLFLFTNCSRVGLYTRGQVQNSNRAAHDQGVARGRAIEARKHALAQQAQAARPQPKPKFYNYTLPPHTAPDGTRFDSSEQIIEIISQ